MNLRALSSKITHSRAARTLATSVASTLLVVQLVVFLPAVYSQYRGNVNEHTIETRTLIQSSLRAGIENLTANVSMLINEEFIGLVVYDARGRLLLHHGLTPGFSEFDQMSTARQGWTRSVEWTLPVVPEATTISATVFLNHEDLAKAALIKALMMTLFALFSSALAALIALGGAVESFIGPVQQLVEELRKHRESKAGQSAEPITVDADTDLAPLAEELNGLIEAHRKTSRQVKLKQQYLEFAAHHDPLTHLPNRLMFENTLRSTVKETLASGRRFAIFLVDLDNFKFFNDQYGHLIGDKMVAEVGNRLQSMMLENDLVARLDGDEFVVIQNDIAEKSSADEVARRIMTVATAPYEYRGFMLKTAVSVGVSSFPDDIQVQQDEQMLGEEMVNNAAVALQEAKSNGKNQFRLFNEKMRSRLTARIRLEQDLKMALQDDQFEIYFQPKINIHTRQCTGAEALVRWRHPINGFVSPEAFVPVAEESGLIIELGAWILQMACRKTRELQEKGYDGLNVAVNISAVQFTDGNLLSIVSKALDESGLSPEMLELEITESAVMHDPEEVISSLHQLSQHGMKLAIDDFGTGYSSLAYLKRFPVDTLKIDRAFITDISNDNDDVAIVEAVLGLGKHFNMSVVAEGVEDEEQLNFLKAQGCDIAQGYFISRPLSSEQYSQWLERWPFGVQERVHPSVSPKLPAPGQQKFAG